MNVRWLSSALMGGTLLAARARFESDHPEEWIPIIIKAEDALQNMTVEKLKGMTSQQEGILKSLKARIENLLEDRSKLV